jgi:hypothetical protein
MEQNVGRSSLSGDLWDIMGRYGRSRRYVIKISKSCGISINYYCGSEIIIHRDK